MSDRLARAAVPVIESVQVMRGFAAFAVVLYHANLILAMPEYGGRNILHGLASRGWLGVNFFFVLSGFIIMLAHRHDIGHPHAVWRYLWRRFSRLYPIYWICLSVYLAAAYIGIGYPSFGWQLMNILSAYALIQMTDEFSLPLRVAWTLFYEVTFYAAFAVLIVNRLAGIVLFAVWLIAIAVSSALGHADMGPLHMWNASFVIGMGTFSLAERIDARWGRAIMMAGLALLLGLFAMGFGASLRATQADPFSVLLLTLPFGMILLGASLAERRSGWRAPRWLFLAGAASYSIYLVHSPVISVVAQLNHRLAGVTGVLPDIALFIFAAGASTLAGVIAHLLIEKPMLHGIHRLGRWVSSGAQIRPFGAR